MSTPQPPEVRPAALLPWEDGFVPPPIDTNLINVVTGAATGAIHLGTDIFSDIAGAVAGKQAHDAIQVVGDTVEAAATVGGNVVSDVAALPPGATPGEVLASAVKSAQVNIGNQIIKTAAEQLQNSIGNVPVPTITAKELVKVDAWERSWRTLLSGVLVTVLVAILNTIATVASSGTTINWFSKEGWMLVGSLAVGSVLTALSSYLIRLFGPEPMGAGVNTSKAGPGA